MSERLINLALLVAYGPLLAMALLWLIAALLGLAGRPGLARWLKQRTSIPQPEENPPAAAHRPEG